MVDENLEISENFEPADKFTVSDLDTLKVLADPLRLNILEYLSKPGTVKQIAGKIGKPPTKLYYHFNLLEKHGLIQMVDTRIVSGIIEKHYQASARTYTLEWGLLSPGTKEFDEGLDVTLNGIFGDARNDLQQSLEAGVVEMSKDAPRTRRLILSQGQMKLSPDEAQEFYERLFALMQEFQNKEADDEGKQTYKMLLMLHPSSRGNHD